MLTEEELYAQCIALLFAGHETTRNLIGNGMYTLLKHPEETAELREKPEMIRTAVEELLAFRKPGAIHGSRAEGRYRGLRPAHTEEMVDPMHARCGEPGSKDNSRTRTS